MEREIIICECHSMEHQIVVTYENDNNDPTVYLNIHLTKRPFWKRLIYGLEYILGRQCGYGAFDEIILNPKDAKKFEKIYLYLSNEKPV